MTISNSGVPVRLRSIRLSPLPASFVVQALAGVLFEMGANDADGFRLEAVLGVADFQPAVLRHRQIVLADLIALGQVGIVVLLAIPLGARRDFAFERDRRLQRQLDRVTVHHRQRPRHADANGASLRIRFGAELVLQPQNSLLAVASCTWTSRPMMMVYGSLTAALSSCASRWLVRTCGHRAAAVLPEGSALEVAGRWASPTW